QRLDVDLTLHLREHAAFLGPRRLAHELHVDTRLDRLVEAHLVQVDVRDVPADRILLVVLEDRRVCRRLSFEDDVEDRVKPSGARQDAAQLALGNADCMGLLAVAVEDAWNEPLLAQAPSIGRPTPFALPNLQLYPFARHFRRRMVATSLCAGRSRAGSMARGRSRRSRKGLES